MIRSTELENYLKFPQKMCNLWIVIGPRIYGLGNFNPPGYRGDAVAINKWTHPKPDLSRDIWPKRLSVSVLRISSLTGS